MPIFAIINGFIAGLVSVISSVITLITEFHKLVILTSTLIGALYVLSTIL